LQERNEYDPSTNPKLDLNLWLEAGSFDEPNKSQVYGILNTITEDI
jgi:hypothetical protein